MRVRPRPQRRARYRLPANTRSQFAGRALCARHEAEKVVSRRWDTCFVGDKVVRGATHIAIVCLLATKTLQCSVAT
jgi:hypothetical protein